MVTSEVGFEMSPCLPMSSEMFSLPHPSPVHSPSLLAPLFLKEAAT